MNIIIVGSGKVGSYLAECLLADQHDIVVIEKDEEVAKNISDTADVMCVVGNGACSTVLEEANVSRADILIAVTSSDELNILCCYIAKTMGAKYTVARVRETDYFRDAKALRKKLHLDMIINPEHTTAVELSRLIRFPEAIDIKPFYRNRVELVGFRVEKNDFLVGMSVMDVAKKLSGLRLLFSIVQRGTSSYIPKGDFVIEVGDKLHVIAEIDMINAFFRKLGRGIQPLRDIMIIGGGKITSYLGEILSKTRINIKVIEVDRNRCIALSNQLSKAMVICGDGTNQRLLQNEHIDSADAFIALTNRDEDNLITALYAQQCGVPKVFVKNGHQNYSGVVTRLGIDNTVSPKLITAESILRRVRAMQDSYDSEMVALYKIADESGEALEFVISPQTDHLGEPLKDIPFHPGIQVAVIIRGGEIIIPGGNDVILEGDNVIIIAAGRSIITFNDIYAH